MNGDARQAWLNKRGDLASRADSADCGICELVITLPTRQVSLAANGRMASLEQMTRCTLRGIGEVIFLVLMTSHAFGATSYLDRV